MKFKIDMPTLCQNSLGKMVKIYHSKDALGKVHSNLIILQIWNVKVMRELHCTVSHDLTKKLRSVELWSSSSLFFLLKISESSFLLLYFILPRSISLQLLTWLNFIQHHIFAADLIMQLIVNYTSGNDS